MTADQIIQFMQAPEKLNQETLPLLKEMIGRYPAFEAGWILYLKNLKNLNDSSFGKELIHAALRIQDRRKLYLFLNGTKKGPEAAETKDDIYSMIFPAEYRLEATEKTQENPEGTVQSFQKKSGKGVRLIDKFLEAQPKMPPIKEKESTKHRQEK